MDKNELLVTIELIFISLSILRLLGYEIRIVKVDEDEKKSKTKKKKKKK